MVGVCRSTDEVDESRDAAAGRHGVVLTQRARAQRVQALGADQIQQRRAGDDEVDEQTRRDALGHQQALLDVVARHRPHRPRRTLLHNSPYSPAGASVYPWFPAASPDQQTRSTMSRRSSMLSPPLYAPARLIVFASWRQCWSTRNARRFVLR